MEKRIYLGLAGLEKPTPKQLKHFGASLGIALVLVFALGLPWFLNYEVPNWPIFVGTFFFVSAFVLPQILRLPYLAWMRFAKTMEWINSHLILGLIYYLFLVPIGFVFRLRGIDLLDRDWQTDRPSYFVKTPQSEKADYERPF